MGQKDVGHLMHNPVVDQVKLGEENGNHDIKTKQAHIAQEF